MGFFTEGQNREQARQSQRETNERLDRIVALLEEQNKMLAEFLIRTKR
jgi:hypothetical protein